MKALGVVRKIDNLGRVVIPAELRKGLGMNTKDPVEIYTDNNCVILKKYQPECIFCGEVADVQDYKGRNICPHCMEGIADALNKH